MEKERAKTFSFPLRNEDENEKLEECLLSERFRDKLVIIFTHSSVCTHSSHRNRRDKPLTLELQLIFMLTVQSSKNLCFELMLN